ncbi:MAG: AtaL-like protein [Gammaproteobacteria bacterium]
MARLVLRVAEPTQFLPGLRGCEIGARSVHGKVIEFDRTLDFGNFVVKDHVMMNTLESIEVNAPATTNFAASRLTIRIEEPGEAMLFVRFLYELAEESLHDGLDAMTDEARRQAWELSDIDTIRRIRELSQMGQLD